MISLQSWDIKTLQLLLQRQNIHQRSLSICNNQYLVVSMVSFPTTFKYTQPAILFLSGFLLTSSTAILSAKNLEDFLSQFHVLSKGHLPHEAFCDYSVEVTVYNHTQFHDPPKHHSLPKIWHILSTLLIICLPLWDNGALTSQILYTFPKVWKGTWKKIMLSKHLWNTFSFLVGFDILEGRHYTYNIWKVLCIFFA